MSLSRWSHSDHYIYQVSENEIQVCLFGCYTVDDIENNYSKIEKKAISEGYGLLSRLELKCYLKLYSKVKLSKINFSTYIKLIHILRLLGYVKMYSRSPEDFYFRGIISNLDRLFKRVK